VNCAVNAVNGALNIELWALLKRWKIGETIGESLEKDCYEKKEIEGCCRIFFLFLSFFYEMVIINVSVQLVKGSFKIFLLTYSIFMFYMIYLIYINDSWWCFIYLRVYIACFDKTWNWLVKRIILIIFMVYRLSYARYDR
jgi:hypothetical protein